MTLGFKGLTPPADGFPWDSLRKILHADQSMAEVQNGEEILPKVSTPEQGARTLETTDEIGDFR